MRAGLRMMLLAAALVAPVSTAVAADAEEEVTAGASLVAARAAFADLDYRRAIAEARRVDTDPHASSQQRLEALEIAGLSYLILGQERAARGAFEELLEIDPQYELQEETGSPKLLEFFESVKAGMRGATFAELVHAAPASARSGGLAELEVATGRGAVDIVEVVARWRGRGDGVYQEVAFRRREHDRWAAAVALPASKTRWVLEYYLEARDLGGRAIGQVGGPNAPLAIPVEPGGIAVSSSSPWYRRWYVVGAGAAALGAGVAVGLAAGGGSSRGTLEPGSVTLSP
jgi:hypothetical protein